MQMLKRMGPLQGLLGMMPGMGKQLKDVDVDDKQVARIEAIIRSMTPEERNKPKVLNGRRRKRIAAGSGTTVTEVNRLVKQFEQVQKVMKSAAKMAGQQGSKRPRASRAAGGSGRGAASAAVGQGTAAGPRWTRRVSRACNRPPSAASVADPDLAGRRRGTAGRSMPAWRSLR
jgi:signal recognition particle subunit SRP54